MQILVITGPPYSGKGTQCEILEKMLNYKHNLKSMIEVVDINGIGEIEDITERIKSKIKK